MSVEKFRSVEHMPRPQCLDDARLLEHIRTLWNRAFTLAPPDFPRGVHRFATIDEANQARFDHRVARMRRTASLATRDESDESRHRHPFR